MILYVKQWQHVTKVNSVWPYLHDWMQWSSAKAWRWTTSRRPCDTSVPLAWSFQHSCGVYLKEIQLYII